QVVDGRGQTVLHHTQLAAGLVDVFQHLVDGVDDPVRVINGAARGTGSASSAHDSNSARSGKAASNTSSHATQEATRSHRRVEGLDLDDVIRRRVGADLDRQGTAGLQQISAVEFGAIGN